MKKYLFSLLLLVGVIFLVGCTSPQPTQKEYVCSNGQVVLDSANCVKAETSFCNVESKTGLELNEMYDSDRFTGNVYYTCTDSGDDDDSWEGAWGSDKSCELQIDGFYQQLYNAEIYCDGEDRCQRKLIFLKDCRDFGNRPAEADARCQGSIENEHILGCTFFGYDASVTSSDAACNNYCRSKDNKCMGKVQQYSWQDEPYCNCDCIY